MGSLRGRTLPWLGAWPGMGSLNMGSACGVWLRLSMLMLTKSALLFGRILRPTHTSKPRVLRLSSYSTRVAPLLWSPHPRNTWFRRWCHITVTQLPGVPTLRTISNFSLEKITSAPSPLSEQLLGASTPVKKNESLGLKPTLVSSCVVSRSSNVFSGRCGLRTSHTLSVPSAHRDSSMLPSLANATDVTLSPGGCAPLMVCCGREA
mmetsp:Transcript_37806/g.93617  ORF Transcript_37806/g.93617 Transcript_37806/m.93617 type:complete len:206 (-) Transcript_37806:1013-1630(-)